jgi:hypothetical protein
MVMRHEIPIWKVCAGFVMRLEWSGPIQFYSQPPWPRQFLASPSHHLTMTKDQVRKARLPPQPYTKKPGPTGPRTASAHKTSTQPVEQKKRVMLTNGDWLTVLRWYDNHPGTSQTACVKHFGTLETGALHFTQSVLSRRLDAGARAALEEEVASYPNAASAKRPRVVTNPMVEQCLVAWQKAMQAKGEIVSGPMLVEKRKRFEELLQVPEEERLKGAGWLQPFLRAYIVS